MSPLDCVSSRQGGFEFVLLFGKNKTIGRSLDVFLRKTRDDFMGWTIDSQSRDDAIIEG